MSSGLSGVAWTIQRMNGGRLGVVVVGVRSKQQQNGVNMKKYTLIGLGLLTATLAQAQSTNVLNSIDGMMDSCQTYYNSAVAIGLGVMVVGAVIAYVSKGLWLRKR